MKRRHTVVPNVHKINGFGRISAFPRKSPVKKVKDAVKSINFRGAACIWRPLPWRIGRAVFHKYVGRKFLWCQC